MRGRALTMTANVLPPGACWGGVREEAAARLLVKTSVLGCVRVDAR